jgi:hypothetical protein
MDLPPGIPGTPDLVMGRSMERGSGMLRIGGRIVAESGIDSVPDVRGLTGALMNRND